MYTTPEMESTSRVPLAGAQQATGMFGQAPAATAVTQPFSAIPLPTVSRPQVSSANLPRISVTGDVALGENHLCDILFGLPNLARSLCLRVCET
jgi:hypothetical protein